MCVIYTGPILISPPPNGPQVGGDESCEDSGMTTPLQLNKSLFKIPQHHHTTLQEIFEDISSTFDDKNCL